ncbi:MAG: DNA-directed RNA polymerase subunit omega [Oligoflexales bacterium]
MARVSIEDCTAVMPNRFQLVLAAASRARQLMAGEDSFVKSKNKEGVTALREIAEGYIDMKEPEDNLDPFMAEPSVEESV